MQWGFQILPDVIIIRLFGHLNQSLNEMWQKGASKSVLHNKRKVIVDFSGVDSVDPLGVVLCGFGLHHFQKLGIPVALIRPPSSLLPMLQGHGLQDIPPVFSDVQDAHQCN